MFPTKSGLREPIALALADATKHGVWLVLVCGAKCSYIYMKTLGELFEQRLPVPSYLCSLSRYLPPGNLPEVVGQDPPSYPPLHPFFSVIETYIQPEGPI